MKFDLRIISSKLIVKGLGWFLLLVLFALSGCGGGGGEDEVSSGSTEKNFEALEQNLYYDAAIVNDGSSITPGTDTIVLDDDSNLQLDESSVTATSMTFSTLDGTEPAIEVGDILAGFQGETGFLRKVTAVTVDGSTVTVTTVMATLAEAFEDADISLSIPLLDYATDETPAGEDLTPISTMSVSKTVTHTIHQDLEYKYTGGSGASASAKGAISIYDTFTFDFDGSIVDHKFNSLTLKNKALLKTKFTVAVDIPAEMAYKPSKEFDPIYEKTFVGIIGGVPVPVKLTVTPVIGLDLSFKGNFSASTSYTYKNLLTTGISYDSINGLTPIAGRSTENQFDPLSYSYSGSSAAKGYVKGVLTVTFYEWIGGPGVNFNLSPYSEMTASISGTGMAASCSSAFNLGIEGTLVSDLGMFDSALSEENKTWKMFDKKATLWSDDACPFNIEPVVDSFTASPSSGNAPLDVSFNYQVSDADESDLTCSFDFDGDGNDDEYVGCTSGSASSIDHTYDTADTYLATLTVTDNEGSESASTVMIRSVSGPVAPTIVNFVPSPSSGEAPLDVTFSYSVTDANTDDTLTCSFDFDSDGITDETISPCLNGTVSSSYSGEGTYEAKLTVSDGSDSAVLSKTITAYSETNTQPVISNFAVSTASGVVPFSTTLRFDVSDPQGDPLTCSVSVNNGTTLESIHGEIIENCTGYNHSFNIDTAGDYHFQVDVSDGSLQATDSTTVTANNFENGSIQGTVTDGDGTGLQGVTISCGGIYETTSSATGAYSIADIEPGTYTVTFTKTGYSAAAESGIVIAGSTPQSIDATLTQTGAGSAVFEASVEFADGDGTGYWEIDVQTQFSENGTLVGVVSGQVYMYQANSWFDLDGSLAGTWGGGSFTASGSFDILHGGVSQEKIYFTYNGTISSLAATTITGSIYSGGEQIANFTADRVQ